MAVKRRIIWMTDEEWTLLRAFAKERGETVSGVIRDFWQTASEANPRPEPPAGENLRLTAEITRLKRELARRPSADPIIAEGSLGAIAAVQRRAAARITGHDAFAEVRPAPKPVRPKRPRP